MPEWLNFSFRPEEHLSVTDVLLKQVLAFLFGCAAAGVYRWTRDERTREARSLMATLVLLTLLISMISSVIGDNVARAFSLVGALSIVRFRTVVEDTRDTAFVILAVGVGMAVGAGYLVVPVILIPMSALAAVLFRDRAPAASGGRFEVVLRASLSADDGRIKSVLSEYSESVVLASLSTARQGAALESVYRVSLKSPDRGRELLTRLTEVEGVVGVELRRV